MTTKTLWPSDWPVDANGWVHVPNELNLRKATLPVRVPHPAKSNIHLVKAVIEYLTEPGDIVLDIMAGSGTVLVGATIGRRVWAIDLNPKYVELMKQNGRHLDPSLVNVIQGDSMALLPIPGMAKLIIVDPPYSKILKTRSPDREQGHQYDMNDPTWGKTAEAIAVYTETNAQLGSFGNLTPFWFMNKMREAFAKGRATLTTPGYMAVIIKDYISGKEVVPAGLQQVKMAMSQGFRVHEGHKFYYPSGTFGNINKAQGHRTIDFGHLLIFRKGD